MGWSGINGLLRVLQKASRPVRKEPAWNWNTDRPTGWTGDVASVWTASTKEQEGGTCLDSVLLLGCVQNYQETEWDNFYPPSPTYNNESSTWTFLFQQATFYIFLHMFVIFLVYCKPYIYTFNLFIYVLLYLCRFLTAFLHSKCTVSL